MLALKMYRPERGGAYVIEGVRARITMKEFRTAALKRRWLNDERIKVDLVECLCWRSDSNVRCRIVS